MITASAPGSLMISGEHAVVYGHPAIACAIGKRVEIRLTPRADAEVSIASALGNYQAPLGLLHADKKLRFVLACIERYPTTAGFHLDIHSQIDPTLGFGSSAAVTVAALAALAAFTKRDTSLYTLHEQALTIIRSLQGRGSGTDLAASLWGGMIAYQNLPTVQVRPLPLPPALLSLRYAGYKTPTAEVLQRIAVKMTENPYYYQSLYEKMGENAAQSIRAAQNGNWQRFYALLNDYQVLMSALGVCDAVQQRHIDEARAQNVLAVKISGSGLGDCIAAFSQTLPIQHLAIDIAPQGLILSPPSSCG